MRTAFLVPCLLFPLMTACTVTPEAGDTSITGGINGSVEQAGRVSASWGFRQMGKLSTTLATASAKELKVACDTGVSFLSDQGTRQTAEKINDYLVNVILKNLNPAVAMAIDTGAMVLDDILQVPAGTMLTQAELATLAAFIKGIGEGCQDYLDGKIPVVAPAANTAPTTTVKAMKPRAWLHLAPPKK